MSKVTRMNWMFAHNFYMTPEKLRVIIGQWKVKNNGVVNTIFTDEFSNSTIDKLREEDGIYGKNRMISNDMINNNPGKSPVYHADGRTVPQSNGYSGTPPSVAFKTDLEKYTTADGVDLYLGVPSNAKGQRMNLIPAGER